MDALYLHRISSFGWVPPSFLLGTYPLSNPCSLDGTDFIPASKGGHMNEIWLSKGLYPVGQCNSLRMGA